MKFKFSAVTLIRFERGILHLLLSLGFVTAIGDLSWASSRTTASVSGTWIAMRPDAEPSTALTLVLHQRLDGSLMGYIPGGTASRVITGGSVSGDGMHLEMEFQDPRVTEIFTIEGMVRRNLIRGTADNGTGQQRIRLQRAFDVLHERRFLFAKPSEANGDPTGVVHLSVVVDERGGFVSGGFISESDCSLFACGGGVTSFSETGNTITVGLETGGVCAGSGSFTATFDRTTKFYSGTYTSTNCAGSDSGTLIGVKGTRTRTDHVAGTLAALGRIADDVEARIPFTAPYPPISPGYMHSGKMLADLLNEFNADVTAYSVIDAAFNRFRNITTVVDADTLPEFDTPLGVDFHDLRIGVPVGGGSAVTFRDADTGTGMPSDTELKYFIEESGDWVLIGNGELSCTEPLFSVLPVSETAISVVTPIGTFNPPAHAVPTDHAYLHVSRAGVPLVSPGVLHLTQVSRVNYLVSPWRQGESDYALDFAVCGPTHGRFGHVVTLTDSLAAHLTGGSCSTYNTADEQVEFCTFPVDIHVSAGDTLGTVDGVTSSALDFGLYDDSHFNSFVNPSRVHGFTLHAVCPYDYFEPTLKEYLLSHVGTGGTFRTEEPRCGTMEIDVPGTAQGLWVLESDPVQQGGDESLFVSLALDSVTSSTAQVLSIGPSSLAAGLKTVTTQHTGRVNRAFSEVGPDGLIYCYTSDPPHHSHFVSLGSDGRLSLEKVDHAEGASPCLNDPMTWTFSVNRITFIR